MIEQPVILVLNAGSSSLKFCVYRIAGGAEWTADARGLIEGIGTSPRIAVRDGTGAVLDDDTLGPEIRDAGSALQFLAAWLRARFEGTPVLGVGHRVVHG